MPVWLFHAITALCIVGTVAIWGIALRAASHGDAAVRDALRFLPAALGATAAVWLVGALLRSAIAWFNVLVIVSNPPPGACTNIDGCYAIERIAVVMIWMGGVPLLAGLAAASPVSLAPEPRALRLVASALVVALALTALVARLAVGQAIGWPDPPQARFHG